MKRIIIILSLLLFINKLTFSIYPPIRNYLRKEINSGSQNWDIIQYENNWMYFANSNGLLEYDGYHWNTYPIENHTNIRSLFYDKDENKIYAGAFNEFGYYHRNEDGILQYKSLINLLDSIDINFNEIWNIHKNNEAVYFQGDHEVFRMKENSIKKLNFSEKIENSGMVHDILIISTIKDGILALNGELFIPLPGGELLKNKKVCATLPLNEQDILFVTVSNGMYKYDGKSISKYYSDIDNFLERNEVLCAKSNNSKIAFGTIRNGVVILDLKTNKATYSNKNSGLQNNTVLSMNFDGQGNLWLGLDKGIDYMMINSHIYNLFGNNRLYGTGHCSIVKDNKLYLGTNQGLYKTDFPMITSSDPLKIEVVDHILGPIWCLKEIDNILFCGTDRGVFILSENEVRQIPNIDGTWKLMKLQAHPDYILGSSYKGFFLLKKENNQWKFSHMIGNFEESGRMFEEDEEGNIWFCHCIKGIYKLSFNSSLDTFSAEFFNTNKGLYTTRNNVLVKIDNKIIISNEGGLFEYNKDEKRLEHSEKYEKLFGTHPYFSLLTQMPSGDIWCLSPCYFGIAYSTGEYNYELDRNTFSYLKNRLTTGLESFNPIDNGVLVSTEDGFLWLDFVKAKFEKSNKVPFKSAIRSIYITNKKDTLVGGYLPEQYKIPQFDYKHNSIRFEFAAPEFRDEDMVNYSYILENYDSGWSVFSATNTKEYTKLPKGSYIFRVKAQNLLESEISETVYKFTILPRWYERTVFIILYVIILLVVLTLLFLYIKKKSKRGSEKIEIQKEKEMNELKIIFEEDTKQKEKEIALLKNQKRHYELKQKSQELSNSTLNIMYKNKVLTELNTSIEKIYDDIDKPDITIAIPKVKKHLEKMQEDINSNIEKDYNWEKFAENFDVIHKNYLKRLKQNFPSLNKGDLKLCAYLKMGLNSKDIAYLMNMTSRGIEMYRYRLRKKLDLNREVNLSDFLNNF